MITIQIKEKIYLILETLAQRNGVALSGSAQWIDGGNGYEGNEDWKWEMMKKW